ncbi:MAG: hypothetical protein K2H36_07470 [Clostridia bacterium]|nr:hypothetical protein [Clostridia bacterium]
MKSRRSAIDFIKDPPIAMLVFWYILTVIAIVASIVLSAINSDRVYMRIITYVVYAIAFVALGYSIYTFVAVAPKVKSRFIEWSKNYELTNKLVQNYGMRTIVFAVGSFLMSAAYGAYNLTLSALEASVWYGVLAGYYILLASMRGGVVFYHRKKRKREKIGKFDKEEAKQIKKYRDSGALLIVVAFALIAAVLQMVLVNRTFTHTGLMIYVSAAYTCYKVTMSIINIVRAKKQPDMTVQAIRNINLADAMVSILALQTSMIHTFGDDEHLELAPKMNAVTGAIVCALVLSLGIFMVVKAKRLLDDLSARSQEDIGSSEYEKA